MDDGCRSMPEPIEQKHDVVERRRIVAHATRGLDLIKGVLGIDDN